jgi:hypothetical protein
MNIVKSFHASPKFADKSSVIHGLCRQFGTIQDGYTLPMAMKRSDWLSVEKILYGAQMAINELVEIANELSGHPSE